MQDPWWVFMGPGLLCCSGCLLMALAAWLLCRLAEAQELADAAAAAVQMEQAHIAALESTQKTAAARRVMLQQTIPELQREQDKYQLLAQHAL